MSVNYFLGTPLIKITYALVMGARVSILTPRIVRNRSTDDRALK